MSKVNARARARAVQAEREAERQGRLKRQENALTTWFQAADLQVRADELRAEAVSALLRDGETVETIATMVDAPRAEVARIRKTIQSNDRDGRTPARSDEPLQHAEP